MKISVLRRSGIFLLSLLTAVTINLFDPTAAVITQKVVAVSPVMSGDYEYNELYYGTVEITGYSGKDKEVVIPSELDGKIVAGIAEKAFYCHEDITSVTIPESVKSIGDYAFCQCTNLDTIIIPEGEQDIGEWVFENTKWFKDQPNGCLYLGENDHIFYSYKGIMPENTRIKIKDGTTHIAGTAFTFVYGDMVKSYEELVSVELPSGLKTIGRRAFQECVNLADINFPDSITKIGDMAFSSNQPWLEKHDEGSVYLGKVLFLYKGDKSKLTNYEIKSGITSIWCEVFRGCEELKTVTIPDSLIEIGERAFFECSSLTSAEIPSSVVNIEYGAFQECKALTKVILPHSIKNIGKRAFDMCDSLKEVTYYGTEDSFNKIVMDEYDRDSITPLLKFLSESANESSVYSQSQEDENTNNDESEKTSENASKNESKVTHEQISRNESETISEQTSSIEENDSFSDSAFLLLAAAVLVVGMIISVVIIVRKKQK